MTKKRLPLAPLPDGAIDVGNEKKTRMRGISKARIKALLYAIKAGMTIEQSCKLAGISKPTYYNWLNKGEQGLEPYVYFFYAIEQAYGELEEELISSISQAATQWTEYIETSKAIIQDKNGKIVMTKTKTSTKVRPPDWRAALALLERRFPEQWRLDRPVEPPQTENTLQADLLAIDMVALGMALPVK